MRCASPSWQDAANMGRHGGHPSKSRLALLHHSLIFREKYHIIPTNI